MPNLEREIDKLKIYIDQKLDELLEEMIDEMKSEVVSTRELVKETLNLMREVEERKKQAVEIMACIT